MPTRADVIENLNWLTERLSDRVWSISVGVLATSLAYVIESAGGEDAFLEPRQVAGPAAAALVALLADLIQYFAASRQNLALLRELERSGEDSAPYDKSSFAYRTRISAFNAKLAACVAAAVWIVAVSAARVLDLLMGTGDV